MIHAALTAALALLHATPTPQKMTVYNTQRRTLGPPTMLSYLESTSKASDADVKAAKAKLLAGLEDSISLRANADAPTATAVAATPPTTATPPTAAPAAAGFAGLARWDPQAWVVPALWNTPAFRAGTFVSVIAALAAGTRQLGVRAAAFAHLSSFAVLLGSMTYTTFFAGITMYKNLPRQTFGRLQSKLFPVYFKLHAASLCVMIGSLPALAGARCLRFPIAACATALALTLSNILYIEPASTKVMFERYELENEGKQETDEYKAAAKKFGPLHGLSSLANLGALMATVGHSWWLGGLLF